MCFSKSQENQKYQNRKSAQNIKEKNWEVYYNMDEDKQDMEENYITISFNNDFIRFKEGDSVKKFWHKVREEFEKTHFKNKERDPEPNYEYYGVLVKLS